MSALPSTSGALPPFSLETDAAAIRLLLARSDASTPGKALGVIEAAGWMQTGGAESKQESRLAFLHTGTGRRIAVIFPKGKRLGREVRVEGVTP